MIGKFIILLGIEDLKKCGRGISLVICTYFVDLIEQHQRIFHLRLMESRRNASRHRTDVGSSVAADLRLIPHTAETDADVFFIQGSRHASRNRGLTGSRRACQAENRALAFLRQGAYGQEFEDSLFYFRKTVVIFLQNLACSCQILIVTGCLIPRKPQQCLDIAADHACLGRIAGRIFQTVDLLGNPLFHLFGGFELLELLLIIFNLGPGIVLAEFLADDFKLLAQNIITLVLIDPLFDFSLNLRTDLLNLNLVGDHDAERIIPLGKLHSLQQFLAVYVVEGQIHADLIHQLSNFFGSEDLACQFLADFLRLLAVDGKQLF